MSVIAGHTTPGSMETDYLATVKGAPETLKPMVRGQLSHFRAVFETLQNLDLYSS